MSLSKTGKLLWIICIQASLWGCADDTVIKHPRFAVRTKEQTGLDFTNKLSHTPAFNLFTYMYFYNGSGVGAGDFNNDGKVDLFFGSNQGQNKLFLNEGSLKFKDATTAARIPNDGGWTTGISVIDINNDGLLDIYVCRVGNYETLKSRNQFLINKGIGKDSVPTFKDEAAAYGLDFSGFSTQAAFFDYDNDDDLDMFLLNHSVHQNNNFRPRAVFEDTYDSLSGDRIFRHNQVNDKFNVKSSVFLDVTKESGIASTAISYGLGVVVADINLDGYQDLYIGNDFHENDYLYINQKNGTFKDEGTAAFMHTSQYSMGVDAADINNDGLPEIISMDMLPSDPYILKRSLGEDSYDLFHEKIGMGYHHQFTRNSLQYNRGNGLFSEVGLYSGVAATDWSWAPLWMDFDNDGWKDLFISNGIPKRMNDIDYVNFVGSGEVQQKISTDDVQGKDISLIKKFPEIKIPNRFYRNRGDLTFQDLGDSISGDVPTFSNGAVYADFDNDGDLDVVVNNIDDAVLLYENRSSNSVRTASIQLKLIGSAANSNAIGAKVVLFSKGSIRTFEKIPAKGFMSSMETPLHIGLGGDAIDSAFVIWPDRTCNQLNLSQNTSRQTIAYKKGLPLFDFSLLSRITDDGMLPAVDMTASSGLEYLHSENRFVEFNREPLIPHEISSEGPALAIGDANGDGLDDVFVGGARDKQSALFFQQTPGRFFKSVQPVLGADSMYENVDACWADIDRDGDLDLAVASGGNEFYGTDYHNTPRIYLNDGKGGLSKLSNPFGNLFLTASCITAEDINGDGYPDFCIAGRALSGAYGQLPSTYIFLNNRNGSFSDATAQVAPELLKAGFVTRTVWCDLDRDGDKDLVASLEWGGVAAFVNNNGRFSKKMLTDKNGWWNFILPFDADGDGDTDFIAGNLGLNSRLKATPKTPVRLYYNDFDGNGTKEQLLTYYIGNKEIPFANKAELEKQMPVLKKKFLYAEDLAKASLSQTFGDERLQKAETFSADYFANALLLNKGGGVFKTLALPPEAQFTSYRDAVVLNANGDDKPDVLLVGNYYGSNIEMGHYDADYGTLLLNQGGGKFKSSGLKGVALKGQLRRVKPIGINKYQAFVVARNNDSLKVLQFKLR